MGRSLVDALGNADSFAGDLAELAGSRETPLDEGERAPDFVLLDADMEPFDSAAYLDRQVLVLNFYGRNAMPSSTRLVNAFSDVHDDFLQQDVVVAAVSLDDSEGHAEFRDAHGVAMYLLADPEGEVCRRFGVWQAREDGAGRGVVARKTFIIGKNGIVQWVYGDTLATDLVADALRRVRDIKGRKNGDRQEHRRHA